MEEEDSNAPSTETATPTDSETDLKRAAQRTKITEPKEEERHSTKYRTKETKERSSRSSKSASSERKRSKSRKTSDDDDDDEDKDVEEDPPQRIKNLPSVTEKSSIPEEKKKSTKKRKSASHERKSLYKAVVLDTQPVDLGNFSLHHESVDESINKISIRRKSLTRDRGPSASNIFKSKSRLKFYA